MFPAADVRCLVADCVEEIGGDPSRGVPGVALAPDACKDFGDNVLCGICRSEERGGEADESREFCAEECVEGLLISSADLGDQFVIASVLTCSLRRVVSAGLRCVMTRSRRWNHRWIARIPGAPQFA